MIHKVLLLSHYLLIQPDAFNDLTVTTHVSSQKHNIVLMVSPSVIIVNEQILYLRRKETLYHNQAVSYLAVWCMHTGGEVRIPILGRRVRCVYPKALPTDYAHCMEEGILALRLEPGMARVFRVEG
jgi:hypothetical protein